MCCSAFHGVTAAKAAERWPNLTLKKIPKMVLARCEWGHDDYSLNVANLPMAQVGKPRSAADATRQRRGQASRRRQGGLFGEGRTRHEQESAAIPADYADWLADMQDARGEQPPARGCWRPKRSWSELYWQIGLTSGAAVDREMRAARCIERLASDVREAIPEMKGFSRAI